MQRLRSFRRLPAVPLVGQACRDWVHMCRRGCAEHMSWWPSAGSWDTMPAELTWIKSTKIDMLPLQQDRRLASHVLSVHKEGHAPAPADGPPPLSPELLRAYIAAAKQHEPHFPRDLTGAHAAAAADAGNQVSQWMRNFMPQSLPRRSKCCCCAALHLCCRFCCRFCNATMQCRSRILPPMTEHPGRPKNTPASQSDISMSMRMCDCCCCRVRGGGVRGDARGGGGRTGAAQLHDRAHAALHPAPVPGARAAALQRQRRAGARRMPRTSPGARKCMT